MHQRTIALSWLLPLLIGAGAPAPSPSLTGDPATIETTFRRSAAISRSLRSGDLYTLPHPHHYLITRSYHRTEFSHVRGADGQVKVVTHYGTSHGTAWDYDTRIPLVLYGPGRIKANLRPTAAASQVDLVPTYAHLLGIQPPRDAAGRVLTEALLPAAKPPKAILTLVIDQGGRSLYAAHPGKYPNIERLMDGGTDFVEARVSHLESETAMGHIAVGTGALPDRTGIPANDFFHGGHGAKAYSFLGEGRPSPLFLESPTLGDHWLRLSQNRAILISQCYSDRAAIGMAGHGSYYKGNKKPLVVFYDADKGVLTTNPAYYAMPDYLRDLHAKPYWEAFTDKDGKWFGHDLASPSGLPHMPGMARLDGDAFVRMIEREPIGADDITDLLYLTLKATDAASHRFGLESLEAEAVLVETDRQVGRIVAALEKKVGKGNYVVALTADHGATPLPELNGGYRLVEEDILDGINERFTVKDKRSPVALAITNTQVWLDEQALAANGFTRADVARYLRDVQVNGKPFYRLVLDRSEIEAERARLLAGPLLQPEAKAHPVHAGTP